MAFWPMLPRSISRPELPRRSSHRCEPQQERARAFQLAQKARGLSGDPTVLAVIGNALTLLGELDTAEAVISKALSLDGGSAWAWGRSGWIDAYRGDPVSAIERFKIS